MRFHIRKDNVNVQDGDYEVNALGGYRHFPERSIKVDNIHQFIGWVTQTSGVIQIGEQRFLTTIENRDAILQALGFPKWIEHFGCNIS